MFMSVAGSRILFLLVVERLLTSERCHRAGRSKHGRGGEGLLVAILSTVVPFYPVGGRAETTRADAFHLPPHSQAAILAFTPEALIANTLRIETRNNLFDLDLRH